jgi:hypothetical protein
MSAALQNFDIGTIIIATLTLITTSSWNTLIQNTLKYYFPNSDQNLTAQTLYTIILTFSASILVYYILNYSHYIKDLFLTLSEKVKTIK